MSSAVRCVSLLCATALLSCVRLGFDLDPEGPAFDLALPNDAAVDAGRPDAAQDAAAADLGAPDLAAADQLAIDATAPVDPTAPFGSPSPVNVFKTSAAEDDPMISADQLRFYFDRGANLFVSARGAAGAPWKTPVAITELNTASVEGSPYEAPDGKTLWFASDRWHKDAKGLYDLYRSKRPAVGTAWGSPAPVVALNSASYDVSLRVVAGGLRATFSSDRSGGKGDFDIYTASRATITAAWSTPKPIAALNSSGRDIGVWFSGDLKVVYFYSNRGGGVGKRDIYVATRTSASAPFGSPTLLGGVNSTSQDKDPWLTPDMRTIYFVSDRNGNDDIFIAKR